MTTIRVKKNADHRYTMISNVPLQKDKRLSAKAKGVLSVMLSFPDDWCYSIQGLCTFFSDGKDSIRSGIKELEKYGYVVRRRERQEGGKLGGTEYVIYEEPQDEENRIAAGMYEEEIDQESGETPLEVEVIQPEKASQLSEIEEYDRYSREIEEIIHYLNLMSGSNYRPESAENRKLITDLLKRHYSVEDIKTVIWKKSHQWIADPKMINYIRPKTLFGPKFETYLNEKILTTQEDTRGGLWV